MTTRNPASWLMTAILALMLTSAVAAEDYYVKPVFHEASFTQADVDAFWPEYPELVTSNATHSTVQVTTESGEVLMISMKIDSFECTLNECPVRIFRDGERLGQRMVCRQVQTFTPSRDGQFLKMCGISYPLASLVDVQPRRAGHTMPYWQDMQDDLVLNHNGSAMRILPKEGKILYLQPRRGLSSVKAGHVLFKGKPWEAGGPFSGTAYTFRKGCPPAPYRVEAFYEGFTETLTLRGAAPVREKKGCRVIGYSKEDDNAELTFDTTFD